MNSTMVSLVTCAFIVQLAVFSIVLSSAAADSSDWPISVGQHLPRLPPLTLKVPYRYYEFNVSYINKTVNCKSKLIPAVNGQFPGPTIYANQGDRIVVKVINNIEENVTIHFHGIRQTNSVWMDGVAYITMCPLKPGSVFVHDFKVMEEYGTYLWHAHFNTMRATLHGAIVIYPNATNAYPFATPAAEFEVVLGEWWYANITDLELASKNAGRPLNASNGYLINGYSGTNNRCLDNSVDVGAVLDVVAGKTYLIRVVHAGVDTELFFSIGGQTMTVVEADGNYVKMFETTYLFLGPGQTTNVLVTANSNGALDSTSFFMSVFGYEDVSVNPFEPVAAFHVLPKGSKPGIKPWEYSSSISRSIFPPVFTNSNTSSGQVLAFSTELRNLESGTVPPIVDRNITIVVGIRNRPCLAGETCTLRFQGALNNFTFDLPEIDLLEADYYGFRAPVINPEDKTVFNETFPDHPPVNYDFTATAAPSPRASQISNGGTNIFRLELNSIVQIVLQGTSPFENHPFHLHGHDFHVVGQGLGNFNYVIDPAYFNLEDPPLRNTVGIPARGWVAIRWEANNAGMWLFHCHLDKHTLEGMQTVFLIDADYGKPPSDMPPC